MVAPPPSGLSAYALASSALMVRGRPRGRRLAGLLIGLASWAVSPPELALPAGGVERRLTF